MEETISSIRESNKSIVYVNRQRLRNEEIDVRRSLATLSISSDIVVDITNKLKTKSLISVTELRNLKNALINDEKNTEIVLNTHGALRGLVRELTGHNERKQYEAAGCCCNLALGNNKAATAVAKAAGPYLIAALNNLKTEFAVTCTWTLGNLAGSGVKVCELLIAQGAVGKLTNQLTSPNRDLSDAAIETLTQIAYRLLDDLSYKHLQEIIAVLQELQISTATLNIIFILSCHRDFSVDHLNIVYLEKLLESFFIIINTFDNRNVNNLIYLVRILANINNVDVYKGILSYFTSNNMSILLQELLNNTNINENLLWLLGNMYNLCSNHKFFFHLLK